MTRDVDRFGYFWRAYRDATPGRARHVDARENVVMWTENNTHKQGTRVRVQHDSKRVPKMRARRAWRIFMYASLPSIA